MLAFFFFFKKKKKKEIQAYLDQNQEPTRQTNSGEDWDKTDKQVTTIRQTQTEAVTTNAVLV